MKQKTKYRIASYLTLAGSIVNFYDGIHNQIVNHVTQKVLNNPMNYEFLFREVSTIKNSSYFAELSDYLSRSIQRTSLFEFGSATILAGLTYYFHRKYNQFKQNSIDNLVLDM